MQRSLIRWLSFAAWVGVWAFWLTITRDFHPTRSHAVVATTSLVVSYAAAAYINHLVLVPRLWGTGRRWRYVACLVGMMALLTSIALSVIRAAYLAWSGPRPVPNGLYKHFAIDLFGMGVHLLLAAGVVALGRRFLRPGMISEN